MPCNNPHHVHLVKDMNHENSFISDSITGVITHQYPQKYIQGSNKIVTVPTTKLTDEVSDLLPSENCIDFYKYKLYKEHELPKNVSAISLPCGKCLACTHSKSTMWATRMIHEAQMHENNCFVTLTFDDYHLENKNKPYSIDLNEIQRFIKRLRKNTKADFRVYYCGEYGDSTGRAHYHLGIMGYNFPDKQVYKQKEDGTHKEYNSEILNKAWQNFGHAHILELNYGTAFYLASYLVKKVQRTLLKNDFTQINDLEQKFGLRLSHKLINTLNSKQKAIPAQVVDQHYKKIKDTKIYMLDIEFSNMSRRPGIGYSWYQKYKKDLLKGYITSNGHKLPIPKYYMTFLKEDFPNEYEAIAQKRFEQISHIKYETLEMTQERLNVKETLLQMKKDNKARDSF